MLTRCVPAVCPFATHDMHADADADAEDLLIAHSSALLDRGVDACAANLKRELLVRIRGVSPPPSSE